MLVAASSLSSPRCILTQVRGVFFCACVIVLASACLSARAFAAGSRDRAQSYLGVDLRDTPDEQVNTLHLQSPRGAEIVLVDHDGPAGKAGLQPHDIVLQANGQNIENAEELRRKIRESSPGASISFSIVRQGRAMTLTAKLANREEVERLAWKHMSLPDPQQPPDEVQNVLVERYNSGATPPRAQSRGQSFIGTVLHTSPYTGATLEPMEPQLADFFGAPPKTGLLVHAVDDDSPASTSGLRAGDVVLNMDSAAVASISDWTKHVRSSKGKSVSLTVLRDKHEMILTLLPDPKRHSVVRMPQMPWTPIAPWT
jgi:serine protease Do